MHDIHFVRPSQRAQNYNLLFRLYFINQSNITYCVKVGIRGILIMLSDNSSFASFEAIFKALLFIDDLFPCVCEPDCRRGIGNKLKYHLYNI